MGTRTKQEQFEGMDITGPLGKAAQAFLDADDDFEIARIKREEAKARLIPEMEKVGLSTCKLNGKKICYSKTETERVTVKDLKLSEE